MKPNETGQQLIQNDIANGAKTKLIKIVVYLGTNLNTVCRQNSTTCWKLVVIVALYDDDEYLLASFVRISTLLRLF